MSIASDERIRVLEQKVADLDADIRAAFGRIDAIERCNGKPPQANNVFHKHEEILAGNKRIESAMDENIKREYEKKFGAPPHHRMKMETILEALR